MKGHCTVWTVPTQKSGEEMQPHIQLGPPKLAFPEPGMEACHPASKIESIWWSRKVPKNLASPKTRVSLASRFCPHFRQKRESPAYSFPPWCYSQMSRFGRHTGKLTTYYITWSLASSSSCVLVAVTSTNVTYYFIIVVMSYNCFRICYSLCFATCRNSGCPCPRSTPNVVIVQRCSWCSMHQATVGTIRCHMAIATERRHHSGSYLAQACNPLEQYWNSTRTHSILRYLEYSWVSDQPLGKIQLNNAENLPIC